MIIGDCSCGNRCMAGMDKCASCLQAERKAERNAKQFKTASKVKVVTDKRAGELREFARLKKEYLDAFMCCEIEGCHERSVDVHHRGTRNNHHLNESDFFLAVCREHHRLITDDSAWAKERGYSIMRTGNHTKI